jgi:magnesium transporter
VATSDAALATGADPSAAPAGTGKVGTEAGGTRVGTEGTGAGKGRVKIVACTASGVRESTDATDLPALVADPDVRVWVDLTDPTPEVVDRIAAALGLHPLVAEDIVERNQRAKVEFNEDNLHLVLFGLVFAGEVQLTELDFVLGTRFLLSAHEAAWEPRSVEGLRFGVEKVLRQGPDFLLWALADGVVDAYFPVLDRIDEEIDRIEDDVIDRTDRRAVQRLFTLKRELIELRRAIVPTRETVGQLTNRQLTLVAPEHVIYFRDVYDHLIRASEDLDTLRDLASGTLEVYLSQVNNNLSLIMKRLTGVTVILAGIGAVAGIFGMSEAGAAFAGAEAGGFWLVTAFVVAVATIAAILLRRFDWI